MCLLVIYAFWNGFVESNSLGVRSLHFFHYYWLLSLLLLLFSWSFLLIEERERIPYLALVRGFVFSRYVNGVLMRVVCFLGNSTFRWKFHFFNAEHHISCLRPKFNCTFPSRSQQYSSDLVRNDLEIKFCFFFVIGLFLCYSRPPFKIYSVVQARDVFHEHSWNHFVFLAGTWN